MNYKAYAFSDIGKRSQNEDSIFVKESQHSVLAIVADGLGGHGEGELASEAAVFSILSSLSKEEVTSEAICTAISQAHQRILQLQIERQTDMMTTVAVVWANNGMVKVAHVGDTRIYHIRGKEILYQSMDHSYVQLEVLMGKLTASEIRKNQQRNLLIRALGYENNAKADIETLEVQAGDRILLCSDGFWEVIDEDEMLECSQTASNASAWLEQMKVKVLSRMDSTSDNLSAIAIDILG